MTFKNMAEVKAANKAIGNHWFDADTMRFFDSRIESELINGRYFVSSEQFQDEYPRFYNVRSVEDDGKINTVRDFEQFTDKQTAIDAAKGLSS